MLRIDIKVDVASYDGQTEAHINRVIKPAIADGLNAASTIIRDELREAAKRDFDRPKPFTINGFTFFKATAKKGRDPDALIRIKPTAAEYLADQIVGGVRRAGDYATTKQGPIVPGPGVKRDKFGNLPRRFIAQQIRKKSVFWSTLGRSKKPALVQRDGEGLKVLALIVNAVDLPKRFDFYGIVRAGAAEHVPAEVRKAMRKRLDKADRQ